MNESFSIKNLKTIHTKDLCGMHAKDKLPEYYCVVEITNEIKPVDLYCYLHARFGPPNGIQNLLRSDDSDNLIHWEWTLASAQGLIFFQGLNFRTEIRFNGDFSKVKINKDLISSTIKADINNYRKEISILKKDTLEKWSQFINPYQRIKSSINCLMSELDSLNLNPEDERLSSPKSPSDILDYKNNWQLIAEKYNRGFGLCFGIRSMIPVMAESFLNLIFFVLCRPEIKSDKRLFENANKQNLDIKIKSLHLNCNGFKKKIEWTNEICKAYNTIVNERNDLLHGNLVIEKLKFDEVSFNGTVPIFKEYKTLWERSLGVTLESVGLKNIKNEYKAVITFIGYVLSCLSPEVKDHIQIIINTKDIGINDTNGRIGILFPDHLVDFRLSPAKKT